jgi:hypothetical protein
MALQSLNQEIHNTGNLAEERAATYQEDLKALYQHVRQGQSNWEPEEGRERNTQSQTLAQDQLETWADMDEYIMNQLPSLIDE